MSSDGSWVTDITSIWTRQGWLYLAVIAPLHELSRVRDAAYLKHLHGVFGVEHFLFFVSDPTADALQQARELDASGE